VRRSALALCILVFSSIIVSAQEIRSSTAIQRGSQSWPLDLTGIAVGSGISLQIQNLSPTPVVLPLMFLAGSQPPLTSAAILADLNPALAGTDQARVTQAWQFVSTRTFAYCSAGTGGVYNYDPVITLNAFGFGCCDQLASALAWIWEVEGYRARIASMSFHTVPEVFYGNAWHMLDPDHRVYYVNPNGTIASVQDILSTPSIVLTGDNADGLDPVQWQGSIMEQDYIAFGSTLQYRTPNSPNASSTFAVRYGESMTIDSTNETENLNFYLIPGDVPQSPIDVTSVHFDWNLSFTYPNWNRLAHSISGIDVNQTTAGSQYIANTSDTPGYVVYSESSLFPLLSLQILAQTEPGDDGSLQAYYSPDGITWSAGVPFQSNNGSFDLRADLTSVILPTSSYSYFIKIELDGAVQLHRLRISPAVQAAHNLSPSFKAGTQNQLAYQDSSPSAQVRSITATAIIPNGSPAILGTTAVSEIPESPAYSAALDYGAANLVDGDSSSLAYPGSSSLDYVIQLNGIYHVTGAAIDWGVFGSDSRYVQSWKLLGRVDGGNWQQFASGGFPGQSIMNVPLDLTATELRVIATADNWIGANEVRVFGGAAPPRLALTAVQSNVQENPFYSLAQGYGAANLIDGNPATLAYPASTNIDYQVSLAGPSHISAFHVNWGSFGLNPSYIDSWSIMGRNGATDEWVTLAQGGFPNEANTVSQIDAYATDVRLLASSTTNWIGAYELSLHGGQLMTGLTANSTTGDFSSPGCGFEPSSNLVDGNESSFAYPCATELDYTIDSGSAAFFDTVNVVWGYFGTSPAYIQSWQLLGLTSDGETWQTIAQGGYPGANETVIPVQNSYRKLRIAATSNNWIGIYEVEIYGGTPAEPSEQMRAGSDVKRLRFLD
jgi:hypothetical protein